MRFINTIPALLAFAGYTSATCNGSGEDYFNQDEAAAAIRAACDSGELSGNFGPQNTVAGGKGKCIPTPVGKIDVFVWHIQEGERTLPPAECYDGLQKEVYGCMKGGETAYENWRYKSDPNAGPC